MIQGKGFDVRCPSCGGRFHETRESFNDTALPRGNMFRLKDRYRKHAWTAFPERENIKLAELQCPWCDANYLRRGRVAKLVDQEAGETLRLDSKRRLPYCDGEASLPEISINMRGAAEPPVSHAGKAAQPQKKKQGQQKKAKR